MTLVIARIILRYLSGALITYGLLSQDLGNQITSDPDLVTLLGAVLGIVSEAWYAWVKKKGGKT